MDKRPRKELIDGIRDSLRDFEDRYDRREWELFQRQRKNKRRKPIPLFVKLAGIAASLFLMVYASVKLLPFFERSDGREKTVPREAPHPQKDTAPESIDSLNLDSAAHMVVPDLNGTTGATDARTGFTPPLDLMLNDYADTHIPLENAGSLADSITIDRPLGKIGALQPVSLFVKGSGQHRKSVHTKPGRSTRIDFPKLGPLFDSPVNLNKVTIGFNVAPAFANKGFSLGGGVSAQIPLSNRLSAELGMSYRNLKVGADGEADRTDTVSLQMVGVRHSVGMVGLPVSLNYAISENFSASLGLMPFRVVRVQRTDILQRYRWVSNGDATGRLEGERTQTKRADSVYMGKTYWGFFQAAGQYSPPLLQKRNIVLSPFVTIPVGRLRDDEYRWLHGGVSVRFYLR